MTTFCLFPAGSLRIEKKRFHFRQGIHNFAYEMHILANSIELVFWKAHLLSLNLLRC